MFVSHCVCNCQDPLKLKRLLSCGFILPAGSLHLSWISFCVSVGEICDHGAWASWLTFFAYRDVNRSNSVVFVRSVDTHIFFSSKCRWVIGSRSVMTFPVRVLVVIQHYVTPFSFFLDVWRRFSRHWIEDNAARRYSWSSSPISWTSPGDKVSRCVMHSCLYESSLNVLLRKYWNTIPSAKRARLSHPLPTTLRHVQY